MSETRREQEQIILDHNRKPRNFHEMQDADAHMEGFNPLCGDNFTIYLKRDGDTITDCSFTGEGCAISKAATSLLTTVLPGKTEQEARALFEAFQEMLHTDPGAPVDSEALGALSVLAGVRAFPIRIKCATLAWRATIAALDGEPPHRVSVGDA
jgi:nitrogen fixation NifU-like protein